MRKESYVAIGFIVMCFNSLYQYSWNAFEPLFEEGFKVGLVEIAIGFTLFNIFSSTFQPIGGNFADKLGPRNIGIIASFLSAIGFLGTSFSPSILFFYVFWSLGSIGEGILYGIAVNLAVKWFKRGTALATGLVSLGFGLGSAVADPFILMSRNFRDITLIIGIMEFILLPILLSFAKYPMQESGKSPKEAIISLKFWLIYASYVTVVLPLLVISSSLFVIGKKSEIPTTELYALISIFPVLSGSGRPFFGYIADRLGVIKTTLLVNILLSFSSFLLFMNLIIPSVVMIGLLGGSIITLYFNVSGIVFGTKYSTVNNGILYTGKAVSGFLGSVMYSILFLYGERLANLFVLSSSIIGVVIFLYIYNQVRSGEKSQVNKNFYKFHKG
ncbi:MFS transporter [Acidianus manzaensis]|uniref:Oxalate/formate antiport family MFS transporter n=1 Tax=Acidianus manzaensis TaxID=282676 RepID=A0A1W6JX60_9CREN|nr:MFS transporter [Acidianus manzaensis]ARM74835.1 oxalate/formate antiport family MFS transporter [Acidianus manzaensis]